VFFRGAPKTHIYGVISGIFRVFMTTPKGDEITLEEVVSGGWFPHTIPDENPIYQTHCTCQEEAVVVSVPQAVILEFSERWPGFYRGLYHELTSRAAVIGGRIELLSLHNLRVRMAVYFLRMALLRGETEADGVIYLAAIDTQTEVGARVGGTRQSVNTVMKAWARRGLLAPHKDGFRILDIKGLTAEAKKTGFDIDTYLSGWHGGWQGSK
jgi:CRP-like cAMP-binding protein